MGTTPPLEREWVRIAQERIRQIDSGDVTPLDGARVLAEMRELAKRLARR